MPVQLANFSASTNRVGLISYQSYGTGSLHSHLSLLVSIWLPSRTRRVLERQWCWMVRAGLCYLLVPLRSCLEMVAVHWAPARLSKRAKVINLRRGQSEASWYWRLCEASACELQVASLHNMYIIVFPENKTADHDMTGSRQWRIGNC